MACSRSPTLRGRSGIDAIHIIGHGAEGSMRLGSVELNAAALGGRESQLAAIGAALTAQGDILLYGCDIGANARARNCCRGWRS